MNELSLFVVCQLISLSFGWVGNRFLLNDNTRLGSMVVMSHVIPQFLGWLMLFGMVFTIRDGLMGILSLLVIALLSGVASFLVCFAMHKIIAPKQGCL